ncbi:uncharacterized protein LOC143576806 [Bidens hawaiensis]|uniref:uncharacterized protein LOC143576806 n=1 Tax=Bidens hawaiensis TaxID=980011 RepID=UPI00404A7ECB
MAGMAPSSAPGNDPMGMDMGMGMDGLPGSNTGMYILALVLVFSLAIIMEWMAHNNPVPTKSNRATCTMLYALRVVFSYFVMLSVMSFNVGTEKGVRNENRPRLGPKPPSGPRNIPTSMEVWNHLPVLFKPARKATYNCTFCQVMARRTLLKTRLKSYLKLLKIALFVKKWPDGRHAGGLERHALTLPLALAKRGHELHVFTSSSSNLSLPKYPFGNLHFHLSKPTNAGYLDQATVWKQFEAENSTQGPFDVVHTESVSLRHTRSKNVPNLAVSWHGIAYASIHSDIIQELLRAPNESQPIQLTERGVKVVEEIKFFQNYAHHVATSDHVGDILKRIYMISDNRVHIILNGVDEDVFKPNNEKGQTFRSKFGIPESKTLIIGMAGRLVKDKGHPLMFEALKQIFVENSTFNETVAVLVAGDGPWGARYKDIGPNLFVLGPLQTGQLAGFYNAIDVFVNTTLRAQGLDHTLLEAVLSGKPLMATKLASITGSVIIWKEYGYTFSPTVDSLKNGLYEVWNDGRVVLEKKGKVVRERGLKLFTATKMAAAYERLFLCISNGEKNQDYCKY